MTRLGPYEVHPVADAFPLLEGDELHELAMDIKSNGLSRPLVLNHDKTILIDGRNRYRACEIAGVDLVYETLPQSYTDEQIIRLIVSLNLARRHLNPGQLAMLALEVEKALVASTKDGRPRTGVTTVADRPPATKTRDLAAQAVGASGRLVQRAKAVTRDTPDLADRVRTGQMALDAADKERKARLRAEPKPEVEKPSPVMLTLRTHTGEEVPYPQPKATARFNETKGEGISWAKWSWNPVTGCLHGCDYCYARELATRESYRSAYPVGFTPLFHHERLDAPTLTVIPEKHRDDPAWRRVFVCSMADLYGRWVPDEWIGRVHDSMLASPQWEYLLLTKFPSRYVGLEIPATAWVGTSVDEQKRVRIAEDAFREISDVKVRWLSLEPLREPLQFNDLSMFDWVVIGAQTETRQPDKVVPAYAPPFEWVARIVAQAREAGCRVHLKPNLAGLTSPQLPGMAFPDEYPT